MSASLQQSDHHSPALCFACAEGDVSKGDTITPYAGPTPPRGTHRYIFMMYEQVRNSCMGLCRRFVGETAATALA